MAEPKSRVFRAVVQVQLVEVVDRYSSATELIWTQRMLVIPIDRVKAFDLDGILESMVKETLDMSYEAPKAE